MNSPKLPAPHPIRRLRRPWPIALGLFVAAFVAAGAAHAQPVPPSQPSANQPPPSPAGGPVESLQDILKGEGGPDLAARKDKITQLINGMDLTQLSRVLLLQEWRTLEGGVPRTEAERKRMEDDSAVRTLAAERFRQKAKEAIQAVRETPKGTTPEQRTNAMLARAATADLIGETAAAGRKLDYLSQISGATTPGRPNQSQPRIGYLAQQLSELTPDLIELTKFNDPTVPEASALAQRAAARALGQIQPLNPAEVVVRWQICWPTGRTRRSCAWPRPRPLTICRRRRPMRCSVPSAWTRTSRIASWTSAKRCGRRCCGKAWRPTSRPGSGGPVCSPSAASRPKCWTSRSSPRPTARRRRTSTRPWPSRSKTG